MYGMSERTFYYLVERAKKGSRAEDLKDKPSKPKNPYRKLTDEDIAEIINLHLDDINRIESHKHAFVGSMEKTDHVLKPESVQQLTRLMDKAVREFEELQLHSIEKRRTKKAQFVLVNHGFIIFLLLLGLLGKRRRLKIPNIFNVLKNH